MKKEIAELWTKALRSGKYNQASGILVAVDPNNGDTVGHCCLGVLCELAVEAGVDVVRNGGGFDSETERWGGVYFDDSDALLPPSVREWARMESSDGTYYLNEEPGFTASLASDNDDGASFLKLADTIDARYEEL